MSLGLLATPTVTICKVAKMVFNVAPGNFYLSQYLEYQEANGTSATVAAMANLAGGTDAAFITTVLTNLGLADDAGAQAFLESSIAANGRGGALEAAITALNNVAADDATYGAAKTTFDTAIVTSVSYSTNTANNSTDSAVLAAAVDPVAVAASSNLTLTLTTSVDGLTGGDGADTFVADNTGTTAASSTADVLNGGGGTDKLQLFTKGTLASAAVPNVSNIETLEIYDLNVALDVSSKDFSSVVVNRGEGDDTITLGTDATATLLDVVVGTGTDNAAQTIAYKAAATSGELTLNGVTAKGTDANEDVAVTGAALTSFTVNTSGTKSKFDALDLAAAKTVTLNLGADLEAPIETTGTAGTLTITGTGAAKIGALAAGLDTVNASGNSGGLTAQIGANSDTILTGSSVADVITASSTDSIASSAKLAVNAGDGTDILVVGDANDVNTTADGARYTNFETVRLAGTQDMQYFSGITAIEMSAASSKTISNITADQASNITILGNQGTAFGLALASSSGSSDSVTMNLASATSTTNVTVAALTMNGVETLNLNATTGTAATDSTLAFAAADKLTAINVTGTADVAINGANITKAVTIGAGSDGYTGALTVTGAIAKGSVVTGTDAKDEFTVSSTLGSTYNGAGGNDKITAAVATLVADGTDDTVVQGGDGTDELIISDTAATLTDNHFTFVSGMEKITTSTGDTSITTGGGFSAAFTNGLTLATGTLANDTNFTYVGGLYAGDTTITIDGTSLSMDTGGDDLAITTGAGADTVTFTGDATTTGNTGSADGASLTIATAAGDDTIEVTHGTLSDQSTSQFATITPGTGADTITKTGTNGTTVTAVTIFTIAAGDSLTTGRDKITGYQTVTNAGSLFGDKLDIAGATVASSLTSTDSGSLLSHAISNGMVTFDDAASFSSAVTIGASNLQDALDYLAANVSAGETVAFLYDSNGDSANDATMVFDQHASNDTLIELVGVTADGVSATATLTTDNFVIVG